VQRWIIVIVIGLVLRLGLAWGFYGNFDQDSYATVTDIMQRGGQVYTETERYNYTPLWMHTLFVLRGIADGLHLPFHGVVRTFLTLADLTVALLIVVLMRFAGRGNGLDALTIYWLNPGAIVITGYHGQFEVLAMIPTLLAMVLHYRWEGRGKTLLMWSLFTLSLIIKHDTAFVIWPLCVYLYGWRRGMIAMLASVIVFLLTFIPYVPTNAEGIARNVFLYQSHNGMYGLSLFLPRTLNLLLMVGAVFITPIILNRNQTALIPMLTYSLVAWFVFTTGLGVQYLTLLFVIGVMDRRFWGWLYVAGIAVCIPQIGYVMDDYSVINVMIFLAYLIIWGMCTLWLLRIVNKPIRAALARGYPLKSLSVSGSK
jgi:hypothetical protein